MLLSAYCKLSLFNAHELIMFVRIYMNVNKLFLKQPFTHIIPYLYKTLPSQHFPQSRHHLVNTSLSQHFT